MSYADELLQLAHYLANLQDGPAGQATLRRAVSTAYYALFHLLISEATQNWAQAELRPALGRIFEHGIMRSASEKRASALKEYFKANPPAGADLWVSRNLQVVVNAFVRAQQERNEADYNTAREWARVDALAAVDSVGNAFESWRVIRHETAAQAYLVSLLGKDRTHG